MAGTCQELLKWKFAHMNSVDFRYFLHPKDGPQLQLLETRRGAQLPQGRRQGYHALEGAGGPGGLGLGLGVEGSHSTCRGSCRRRP